MSNDANWDNVSPEQIVNITETDMLAECLQADKHFFRKTNVGVDIGGYIFSNCRELHGESDEA